jgi:serine/threonine protein kinase/Tfp pilus assembly protein PilF
LRLAEDVPASPTQTLEIPKDELSTGALFAGRYQIIEELGQGGMGKVYKALDTKIKERMVLKLLKPQIALNKEAIERFNNELKFTRKIRHRNVCQIYDLNEVGGNYFITMEYVPGEDLKSMIRMSGKLSVDTALKIAMQVCDGLAEAHRTGIVHRDLKPQNIMIDKEGHAKIMDFGIARSIRDKGITDAGTVIGTPAYMAPEQAEGKEVDQRSDIYSLGVLLYEMLTGREPFEGDSSLSIALKHRTEIPQKPSELDVQIPVDLDMLILKCMEKDKENRYQTAEELLSALKQMGGPGAAKPVMPKWKNSIAVLPFMDLSPEKDQEYFCDGLAEELINSLAKIEDLRTVARTSAFSFKGKDVDIREMGKKLNVESVLEGSVRKSGKRLRISAQLIHVADGYHLWSERYDREMEDVFTIQDEIAEAIVNKLIMKLAVPDVGHSTKCAGNLEAYDAYLRGKYHLNKFTNEGLRSAITCFEEAMAKDANYAPAYAAAAESYQRYSALGLLASKDAITKARAAAQRALDLDSKLAEGHFALAMIAAFHEWDRMTAKEEFKRALELSPNYAKAQSWYAIFLMIYEKKYQQALGLISRAEELDPLELQVKTHRGWLYCFQRRFDEAVQLFEKLVEREPYFAHGHYWLGCSYVYKELYDKAIDEFDRAIRLGGRSVFHLGMLGVIYARMGNREKAKEVLAEVETRAKEGSGFSWVARIYAALGEINLVFENLEMAYEKRDPSLTYIADSLEFENVRSDQRFKGILEKIGIVQR